MRTPVLTVMLIFLLTPACVSHTTMPFHRKDIKIGGFTKHFAESLFKVTEKRLFSIELLLREDGLKPGRNDFEMIVHNDRDMDIEGADLRIALPVTGQGVIGEPVIKDRGNGLYRVENLHVTRSGPVVLNIEVAKDKIKDRAVFYFHIGK